MNGGGGYCGGNCETAINRVSKNGYSEYLNPADVGKSHSCYQFGASYYDSPSDHTTWEMVIGVGGQAGEGWGGGPNEWFAQMAGDGGIAGKGGEIIVSTTAIVNSYNGNKYTDEILVTNDDGTKNTEYITGHEPPSMNPDNQAYIYAQDKILRTVYKYNFWWGDREDFTYEYYNTFLGDTINKEAISTFKPQTREERKNVIIRKEQSCAESGYKNSDGTVRQGIGSGAGYIEISNGTYKLDSTLN